MFPAYTLWKHQRTFGFLVSLEGGYKTETLARNGWFYYRLGANSLTAWLAFPLETILSTLKNWSTGRRWSTNMNQSGRMNSPWYWLELHFTTRYYRNFCLHFFHCTCCCISMVLASKHFPSFFCFSLSYYIGQVNHQVHCLPISNPILVHISGWSYRWECRHALKTWKLSKCRVFLDHRTILWRNAKMIFFLFWIIFCFGYQTREGWGKVRIIGDNHLERIG